MDLQLRFNVLEVIELKSAGWNSNAIGDNVQKNKFKKFSKQKEIEDNRAGPENGDSDCKTSSLYSSEVKIEKYSKQKEIEDNQADPENVEGDSKRRSLYSTKVSVGGVEVIVKSKSKTMMENSKKALRGYFSLGHSGNRVFKYSKEQLLALSGGENDAANWRNVVKFIPKHLVRAEYL